MANVETIGIVVDVRTQQAQQKLGQFANEGKKQIDSLAASSNKLAATFLKYQVAYQAFYKIKEAVSEAVSAQIDFNQKIAEVSTLFPKATVNMSYFTDASRALAAEFNTLPVDQAKAFYWIVSSGATDAADANSILTASNKLAVGGLTSVETAADGVTTILNAYGMNAVHAGEISDQLFAGMRIGKTTIDQLSRSFGTVAQTAASVGVKSNELIGALSGLTTVGISTREAQTALNQLLRAFIAPSKEAQAVIERLGLDMNASAIRSKGLEKALYDVFKNAHLTQAEMVALAGSVRAYKAAATAANTGAFARGIEAVTNAAGESDMAVEKTKTTWWELQRVGKNLVSSIGAMAENIATLGGKLADNEGKIGFWHQTFKGIADELARMGSGDYSAILKVLSYLPMGPDRRMIEAAQKAIRDQKEGISNLVPDLEKKNQLEKEAADLTAQRNILIGQLQEVTKNAYIDEGLSIDELKIKLEELNKAEAARYAEEERRKKERERAAKQAATERKHAMEEQASAIAEQWLAQKNLTREDITAEVWLKKLAAAYTLVAKAQRAQPESTELVKQRTADIKAQTKLVEESNNDREKSAEEADEKNRKRMVNEVRSVSQMYRQRLKLEQKTTDALIKQDDRKMHESEQLARALASPFQDMAAEAIMNGKITEEFMQQMFKRIAANIVASGILTLLMSIFGAFAGGGFGFSIGGLLGGGSFLTKQSKGGMAEDNGMWLHAAKGLVVPNTGTDRDVYPTLLRRGEQVLTPEERRGGVGTTINISAPMSMVTAPPNSAAVRRHFRDSVVPAVTKVTDSRASVKFRRVVGT